jgi:hypothetical protein
MGTESQDSTGSVSCTVAGTVSIGGSLVQRVSRTAQAEGYLVAAANCVPPSVRWEARVSPISTVPYGGGPAQIAPIGQTQDPFLEPTCSSRGQTLALFLTGMG